MGVYLPIKDYSAMQGPAPDGFHVPSKNEWVALCGILTSTFSMESNDTTMKTYLKMPMAGLRHYGNANVNSVGAYAGYLSSTPYSTYQDYTLNFSSYSITPSYINYRARGLAIRCFKNSPTVPTSSWTTLYQGSGSAGVFWNNTDGLISVSGDGTTWYTIQDKNLGATTVYNQGDTETDANCGYFYQWGNNYGFPHSGTVTTSSTKVDASNYGPGNYYNSSIFITMSSSPYDWSSVQNDNLWGATTGVKPMSELKNAYIGEYIEEVFTFAGISGDTTNYKPIAKSGHKVEKVIIQSNCIQNASLAGAYFFITSDTTRNYEGQLSFNIGSSNTSTFSGVRYRTGGSNIDEYGINSYVNYTTNNTFTMTFGRTGWELTVNGNSLSGTYSTSMASVINTIMNSANIQYRQATSSATMGTQTVTVVYTKN